MSQNKRKYQPESVPTDWIEWSGYPGATSPVDPDTLVQVKFMNREYVRTFRAGYLYWWIDRSLPTSIKCYRIYAG